MLVRNASVILALGGVLSLAGPAAATALLAPQPASTPSALASREPPLRNVTEAAPPAGLIEFCRREPGQCQSPGQSEEALDRAVSHAGETYWRALFASGGGRTVGPAATARRAPRRSARRTPAGAAADLGVRSGVRVIVGEPAWALVESVNRDVNRSILQTRDQRQYAVPDYWAVPSARAGLRARGDCEDFVLAKRAALLARGVPSAALSIALVTTAWNEPHAVLLVATDKGDFVLDNLDERIFHWSRANLTWRSRQRPGDLLRWIDLGGV